MIQLTSDESRVLGVLIEKAQTTPDLYPLTLNAIVNGANQKNNRDPVIALDENRALDAVNGLRDKGLLIQVDMAGSRVSKYRHHAAEKLGVNLRELVLLAELLLRGPQTAGELRSRASRMHPLDTLEMVTSTLDQLLARPEPLVRKLSPAPGSRAERYAQLLCLDLHSLLEASQPDTAAPTKDSFRSTTDRLAALELQVAHLTQALRNLAQQLGEPDPLSTSESDEA